MKAGHSWGKKTLTKVYGVKLVSSVLPSQPVSKRGEALETALNYGQKRVNCAG